MYTLCATPASPGLLPRMLQVLTGSVSETAGACAGEVLPVLMAIHRPQRGAALLPVVCACLAIVGRSIGTHIGATDRSWRSACVAAGRGCSMGRPLASAPEWRVRVANVCGLVLNQGLLGSSVCAMCACNTQHTAAGGGGGKGPRRVTHSSLRRFLGHRLRLCLRRVQIVKVSYQNVD